MDNIEESYRTIEVMFHSNATMDKIDNFFRKNKNYYSISLFSVLKTYKDEQGNLVDAQIIQIDFKHKDSSMMPIYTFFEEHKDDYTIIRYNYLPKEYEPINEESEFIGYSSISNVHEYIIQYGFNSLYKCTISCEDVHTPNINLFEFKKDLLKFISYLEGVKHLLIIDPYFFATQGKNKQKEELSLLKEMLNSINQNLESITFFTNEKDRGKENILSGLEGYGITIECEVRDDIHDRFWIDIDNNKSIVFGTSFNGILSKKLFLFDKLNENDTKCIIDFLCKETQN